MLTAAGLQEETWELLERRVVGLVWQHIEECLGGTSGFVDVILWWVCFINSIPNPLTTIVHLKPHPHTPSLPPHPALCHQSAA